MLRDNGIMEKYPDMIKAMGDVVTRGGFGTSVTPVSQFYFQQAFNNVMFGPWEKIAEPYGQMVLGYFGKTPVPPDPEVVKIAAEQLGLEPTDQPPLERNDADPEKGVEAVRRLLEADGIEATDEHIFIVATCGDKGLDFLKGNAEVGVRKIEKQDATAVPVGDGPAEYTLQVNGKAVNVKIDGNVVTVNGKAYTVDLQGKKSDGSAEGQKQAVDASPVRAQMPGKVIRVLKALGDHVNAGEAIVVLEAMKMEVQITSPNEGSVVEIPVSVGDQVANGQTLAMVG
jgi:pyruvate carboxylase subunit B